MSPPTSDDRQLEQSIRRYFDELAKDPAPVTSPAGGRRHRPLVLTAVVVVVVAGLALIGRSASRGSEEVVTVTVPPPVTAPGPTAAPENAGTTVIHSPDTANPLSVNGVVELNDHDPRYSASTPGQPCTASPSYPAIHSHATLTVTDTTGTTIATTTLEPGRIATGGSVEGRDCEFPFAIAALPMSTSYVFTIEDGPANSYTRSFLEASSQHLTVYVGACC